MANGSLILVGGTGLLGSELAKGLVTAHGFAHKKALVRDHTTSKAQALHQLGWTLITVNDFTHSELEQALQGAQAVVSALGGSRMVALETAVIRAAQQAGASLYVPSQFGVDYRRWGTDFPFMAAKAQVLQVAADVQLPTLQVFNGMFSDTIFGFLADPVHAKARVVGTKQSSGAKMSFTRRSDIGHVLARALADPALLQGGGTLSIQGDHMTWGQALQVLSQTIGKDLTIEYLDPEQAQNTEMELLKKGLKGDMASLSEAFALHLLGEAGRGNDGADTSAQAVDYGVQLESLGETLQDVYGDSHQ